MPVEPSPVPILAPVARGSSGFLRTFHKFVSEVGPTAGLLRVLFRVGEATCRHIANLCEEVEKLAPVRASNPGGIDAPALET